MTVQYIQTDIEYDKLYLRLELVECIPWLSSVNRLGGIYLRIHTLGFLPGVVSFVSSATFGVPWAFSLWMFR
jgi:hypothetical protein